MTFQIESTEPLYNAFTDNKFTNQYFSIAMLIKWCVRSNARTIVRDVHLYPTRGRWKSRNPIIDG
jgi:hypothetical protein